MQQEESSETMSNNNGTRNQPQEKCPRCDSDNTKFCYYNNYSLSQPRYFCKACRRYWTHGGTLRNVPIGGGSRKRPRTSTTASTSALVSISPPITTAAAVAASAPLQPIAGYFSPFEAIQAAPAPATAMSLLQGLGDMSNPFGQFHMMNNQMLPGGGSTSSSSSSHQAWRAFNNLASSSSSSSNNNNNNNNNNGAETAVWNLGNYSGAPGSHQWPDSHLSGSFGSPPA